MSAPGLPRPPAAPHLPLVPPAELQRRAGAAAAQLRAAGLDGAFLLHPSSTFWISGTLAQAWPYVDADGNVALPVRSSVGRAALESPLPQAPARHPGEAAGVLRDLGVSPRGRVGVEFDVVPVAVLEQLRRAFADVEFVDASLAVRRARSVKSPYEIDWIEKAGVIVNRAMDQALPPRIREGVREIELMAFLEGHMREHRHQGLIRMRRWNLEMHFGTVSAGLSASYPCYFDGPDGLEGLYPAIHQGGGERALEAGQTILVDFVGAAGGYLADRTRVFCVGPPPPEARDAHDFCRAIQDRIAARLRPGEIPSRIHADVQEEVGASPWADRFMGWGENQVKFLGHGVGLDLDELPVLAAGFDDPLEAGQVIAVEPKVFLGGIGAVGVENTWVVTEGGGRSVTPGPEEIRVVPRAGNG